ncbi:MAG: type II toxin-antitoxin system death-on-curing family toxin [Candidatus Helarchaeota archaeon]
MEQIHYLVIDDDEYIDILNPNQLQLTVDRRQYGIFGISEDFFDKCSILFRDIVSGHIFFDGTKRTGFATLDHFLRINGYEIKTQINKLT